MLRAAIIAALLAATSARVELWRSPVALWADAVHGSPEKSRPRLALALAQLNTGRNAEACETSAWGAVQFPVDADEFAAIEGQALLNLGRYGEAAAAFERAAELSPSPRTWANAGSARYQLALQGQDPVEPAIEDYRRSLALEVTPPALDGIADLMFYSGQWKEAAKRGLNPDDPASRYIGGKWAFLAGDYRQAAALFNQEWALAQFNCGLSFYSMGRADWAIAPYRAALVLDPLFSQARFNLGLALYHTGKQKEGVSELERSGLLQPFNPNHQKFWRAIQEAKYVS